MKAIAQQWIPDGPADEKVRQATVIVRDRT
jgi:hypothetical protein